jgi:hypothetical protein
VLAKIVALSLVVMATPKETCVKLPINFGPYRLFSGVAVSDDFRKYAYIGQKGNLIEGNLPKYGNLRLGGVFFRHKWQYKNGNVEVHQVCVYSGVKETFKWCGEAISEAKQVEKETISYTFKIVKTLEETITTSTSVGKGCRTKRNF